MYDIKQGNCLDLMKEIKDKSIDMICCDLPYGVTANKKDIALDFSKLWEQYERIIKDNGAIVLFAQGIFYVDLVNSNKKLFRYDLVWDKQLVTGFLNANRMPLRVHEQIAIFYKELPTYNPQKIKGEPSHSKGNLAKTKDATNNNYGKFKVIDDNISDMKFPKSIISFKKPSPSVSKHRTQKSVELLEWLIKTYSNENETVLDNCMGSGSAGIACIHTNRNFIGFELDEKYFEVAKKWLEEENKKEKQWEELF